MKHLAILICLVISGTAAAQGSATAGSDAAATGSAALAAPTPTPAAPVATASATADARKACTDAMNADPELAKSIIATADKQIDQKTIDAHADAAKHIAKNEKHVIIAYAAMWALAALFVIYLWRRQQALRAEIAALRKDLDAAAKES